MWIDVAFEATLQSPTIIKKKRNEQFPEALGYIPGSTLRGTLASAWIRRYGLGDDFYRLFTQGQQRYPFLYPGHWQSSPYPLTTVSCKRQGGPQPYKHGVEDLLCYQANEQEEELRKRYQCRHPLGEAKQPSQTKQSEQRTCGEDRKPFGGYVYAYQKSQETPPRARLRHRMGVGIDATTGGASHGILYGRSALDDVWSDESGTSKYRPAVLGGLGRIEESYLEKLQALCETPLFLGSERSRGFGQIQMKLTKQERPSLEARLTQFQKSQGDGTFALLLRSPTILLDRYLRNHFDLRGELHEALGLRAGKEHHYQHVKPVHVATWNAVHRIHKDDEWGIAAGSVLYGRSQLTRKDLLSRLQELEEQGIGERREEGFGQVIVCAPLHLPLAS